MFNLFKVKRQTATIMVLQKEVTKLESLMSRFLDASDTLEGVTSYRRIYAGQPSLYFIGCVERLESKIQENHEKRKLKSLILGMIESGELRCDLSKPDPRQPGAPETK
jgi:hypothetical protein